MSISEYATIQERAVAAAKRLVNFLLVQGYILANIYTYQRADGSPDHWVARLEKIVHEGIKEVKLKKFRPIMWVGPEPDYFAMKLPPSPRSGRILYRLPEMLSAPDSELFIVEGEKDADSLAELGISATTSGSSSTAKAADWSPTGGRRCVIWPDNDEAGSRYGKDVVAHLLSADCQVDVIDTAKLDLHKGGDCSDWIARRKKEFETEGVTEEADIRSRLRAEILALPRVSSTSPAASSDPEWPAPLPLKDDETAIPFPVVALPQIMRDAVLELHDYIQAPLALLASGALSVASVATQAIGDIRRDEVLTGPLSLYCLVIAESGERKSAADRYYASPVSDWEREQAIIYQPLIADAEARLAAWNSKHDGICRTIAKLAAKATSDSAHTEQLAEHELKKPVVPIVPRVRYPNISTEGFLANLQKGHPSAAVWSAEGGTFLGGPATNPETVMASFATFNELWSAERIAQDRKSVQSILVDGVRVSVNIMVQPATLDQFVDKTNGLSRGSGFLARFLVCRPSSTRGNRLYKAPTAGMPAMERFCDRIRELLAPPLIRDGDGRLIVRMLGLSPAAFEIWMGYYNATETEQAEGHQYASIPDFASKSAEQAARLAGIFHVISDAGESDEVQGETMAMAVKVAGWYLDEARRIFGTEPIAFGYARKLEDWLWDQPDHRETRREIKRGMRLFRDDHKALLAAEDVLVSKQRARVDRKVSNSVLVVLNPRIDEEAQSAFEKSDCVPNESGDTGDTHASLAVCGLPETSQDGSEVSPAPGDSLATASTVTDTGAQSVSSVTKASTTSGDVQDNPLAYISIQNSSVSPLSPEIGGAINTTAGASPIALPVHPDSSGQDSEDFEV